MARGREPSLRIVFSPGERQTLDRWQRSMTLAAGLARRGKMILWLAAGHSPSDVAQAVGVQRTVVRKWARCFVAYTRPLHDDEMVLPVDEKTSLQPRCRLHPTQPAQPGPIPTRHEHEYKRGGALNLSTPVHCSWINQMERWFSILQRTRLRIADFDSKEHLHAKLSQFICEWNQQTHPFKWSTKSVAKVMAKVPALAA